MTAHLSQSYCSVGAPVPDDGTSFTTSMYNVHVQCTCIVLVLLTQMTAHLSQPTCSLSAPDPDDGTSFTTYL
jgi:hypothetical protein